MFGFAGPYRLSRESVGRSKGAPRTHTLLPVARDLRDSDAAEQSPPIGHPCPDRLDWTAVSVTRFPASSTTRPARTQRADPLRRHAIGFAAGLTAHWPLLALLVAGATVRVLAMVAYQPALFFNDSWGYIFTAFTGHPVSLSYLHPNGYPVLMRLLTVPGRDLMQLVALQHLSGLVVGSLVYAALIHARVPRLIAAIAAALVLLDGYAITLEQYVMPETLFTLTLLVALLLIAWRRLGLRAAARESPPSWRAREPGSPGAATTLLAGLLLAAAVIQRESALFAAPVFVVYLLWARTGPRRIAVFLAAAAVPVLGYAALYDARAGVFGLNETSGWVLYGRVAGFADCAGAGIPRAERPLCETSAQRRSHPDAPDWYIWDGSSPALRLFHGGHQTRQLQERANRVLGAFARRIIVHQPLAYVSAVGTDIEKYFTPGATPFNDAVSATSLPATAAAEPVDDRVRHRVLPGVRPTVQSPAGFVRSYRDAVHVPRPLLALLVLISALALGFRVRARREILLLTGSGMALVVGTAATAGFGIRYLLPAVPVMAIGGSLAAWDLFTERRGQIGDCSDRRGHEIREPI